MSVIVGISSRSDFTLTNAEYRVLMEAAFGRSRDGEDRRLLEAAIWSHFLDLTRLDREQAHHVAWLLDVAAQARLEEIAACHGATDERASCETLQMLLRESFGRPPEPDEETAEVEREAQA